MTLCLPAVVQLLRLVLPTVVSPLCETYQELLQNSWLGPLLLDVKCGKSSGFLLQNVRLTFVFAFCQLTRGQLNVEPSRRGLDRLGLVVFILLSVLRNMLQLSFAQTRPHATVLEALADFEHRPRQQPLQLGATDKLARVLSEEHHVVFWQLEV